jgi:DNA-binding transcriptional MerR regulator
MEPHKEYYNMRETQQMTGLPASTLRYWETQFPTLTPRKDGHGNRFYRLADIELIKRIRFIRDELKITRIEAIRAELQADNRKTDQRQKAVEILQKVRQELANIRSEI